jgi:glycogen synthase
MKTYLEECFDLSLNEDNISNSIITFPKHEWSIYKQYIKNNKNISTLRIFKEYRKYKVGMTYDTQWNEGKFKVIKSELFTSLEEVLTKYPYYNDTMSKKQKEEVIKYSNNKIERLTLQPV